MGICCTNEGVSNWTTLTFYDFCSLRIDLLSNLSFYCMQSVSNYELKNEKIKSGDFLFLLFTYNRAFIVNLGDMLERWSNCIFKYSKLQSYFYVVDCWFHFTQLIFCNFFFFCLFLVRSTLHRVLGNGQERYSVRLLFFHISLSVFIGVFLRMRSPVLDFSISSISHHLNNTTPF